MFTVRQLITLSVCRTRQRMIFYVHRTICRFCPAAATVATFVLTSARSLPCSSNTFPRRSAAALQDCNNPPLHLHPLLPPPLLSRPTLPISDPPLHISDAPRSSLSSLASKHPARVVEVISRAINKRARLLRMILHFLR